MRVLSATTSDGVCEQDFILDDVPGVLWTPAGASGSRPLVLLGHGGGQHKKGLGLVARAHRLVSGSGCGSDGSDGSGGFAAAAIDMPGYGDRPRSEQDQRFMAELAELRAAGEPVAAHILGYNVALAARAVPEWQAVLDALADLGYAGPAGYWGVSLGTLIGVPLAAAEPRIRAAVFGLAGGHSVLTEAAARITIPVEFLLQWDDELVPRADGLALFDALASAEKTLHANPGRHAEVPSFELDSSVRFLARHLRG